MVYFRTQHMSRGVQTVSDGDEWVREIDDEYRRVSGVDLAGDVERLVYVEGKNQNRHYPLGDRQVTVRGEGDIPLDIDVTKGDKLVIEYKGEGTVSDLWLIHKLPPTEELLHRYLQTQTDMDTRVG